MPRRMIPLAILLAVILSLPQSLRSANERRVALVIGNSNYTDAPLRNPVNDATDVAAALKELGFSVTLLPDANQRSMEESIRDFGNRLRSGGVGLFYFAGHGIQYRGRNYLIPVHSEIKTEADVKYEAVDAGRVLAQMEAAGNGLNIIILDACRNNPFARSFRSAELGLAKMDAPTGSILAYATAPGSVAADGSGRNGLYTERLLKHMRTPGLDLPHLFMNVRKDVVAVTERQQVPWESSSLIGDFYFAHGRGIAVTAKPSLPAAITPKQPEPADEYPDRITNSIGQEFVYINPGSFIMGSPRSETGRDDDERQHRVTLTRGFYMQTTEVTQGQWKAVMGGNPSANDLWGPDCPVERVTFDEVQAFISRLRQSSGESYRLPTEAEWEYAARAGTTTAFPNGDYKPYGIRKEDRNLDEMGWYRWNSDQRIHVVAAKRPNDWGLYDMHGNVSEYVQDFYDAYKHSDAIDPINKVGRFGPVVRGGSYHSYSSSCRSATRNWVKTTSIKTDRLGFRLVQDHAIGGFSNTSISEKKSRAPRTATWSRRISGDAHSDSERTGIPSPARSGR